MQRVSGEGREGQQWEGEGDVCKNNSPLPFYTHPQGPWAKASVIR